MKRLIQFLSVVMLLSIVSLQTHAQEVLLISEYIEGSGNNKAIEIFNPNATTVELDSYQIAQSSNGRGWAFYHTFPAGAKIAPFGTYVILNDGVDTDLFNHANADEVLGFPSVVHHNGDDARAIIHIGATDTTFIDVFGDPDNDPGSGWAIGDSTTATKDHTIVRLSSITAGNATPLASFGSDSTAAEWEVRGLNDFKDLGFHAFDNTPFSVRDLNTYPGLSEFDQSALQNHPLVGQEVEFTAVIVSNPKSSGNSTPRDSDSNGELDTISRIHVFVTDTSALSRGREGMSLQIVQEPEFQWLENFERGDIVKIKGSMGFYFSTAQFLLTEEPTFLGSVYINYPQFETLLDPVEVTVDELNMFVDGQLEINWASYSKYISTYVKITNGVASNVAIQSNGRVDWAVNENGSRIYTYDLSLRYRNDRLATGYLPGWNFLRGDEEGEFTPPPSGALVDVGGFLILNGGNDPDGVYGPAVPFSINPFEDGGRWLTDDNGDPFFCTNGEFCAPEGGDFIWPDDLTILGLPPIVSNVALSDSTIAANQAITVTANAEAAEGTIAKVELIYTVDGVADTLAMSNTAGTEYSVDLPGFPDLTSVSFRVEATDDSGFVGKAPESGEYSFFVSDTQITNIAFVQKTADGKTGDSPLAGVGAVPADITATVITSASLDGFISIQDKAAAWSGIFVATGGSADALAEGDIINITEFEVFENFGVSTMNINAFTVVGTNAQMDTMAVTGLLTQDVRANYEPYEGVLVTFSDVKITTNQADGPSSDFGEFEFASRQGGGAEVDTLEVGEGLRYDDQSSRLSSSVNETIKIGAELASITGVLNFSFSNAKLIGGNPAFFDADDFTYPNPRFTLDSPADDASVEVTSDVTVEWQSTSDFDGNDVMYTWVLFSAEDTTEIVAVPSNNNGEDAVLSLSFATVDALLADANLAVGASANFLWNVRVSDGFDSLATASSYDVATNTFASTYNKLELTRGIKVSNENELGVPAEFALKQNYPNPFNPSTNINFALPQASKVSLTVFDMLGRKVATLLNGEQLQAANHSVKFDASALASGMYIYRIEAGSFVSTRKMMLIK